MSKRAYPRLGAERQLKNKQCSCCDQKALKRIDIQVSWLRGEDDVFNVCETHLKMARASQWETLYGDAQNTKEARRAAQMQRGVA